MGSQVSDMPHRELYLRFQIDTNRINSRQQLANMNLLEQWQDRELIELLISETAQNEARQGADPRRARKALSFIFSESLPNTEPERAELKRIERILFPDGVKNANERNDVDIVFNASKYGAMLVTADGGSRAQPGGILGNRLALGKIGIAVMTDVEAVQLVRARIIERDEMAREVSKWERIPIPAWVGQD